MLLAERSRASERMDDPALAPSAYGAVLTDLARINWLTLAYRPTLAFLGKLAHGRQSLRLLDVGFGQGDMLRRIAYWCSQRNIAADLVGVDLNPGSAEVARAATPVGLPIRYVTGDYADLAREEFDCIVSSLVAHHMTREELLRFLSFMERESKLGWFVNDLRRSPLSWLGFPVLATLAGAHPIVRSDGMTSIARSFRERDWHELLTAADISGAQVRRFFPFRLCVEQIR